MMKIKFAGMALLLLIPGLLAGCGGGGSSAPAASTISGVAAVGYPIVGGNVTVKCASGSPLTTTTSSTGAYTVTLSGQTLPCAVEVSGGTANSIANTTNYHSIATTTGTMNVTPLTDLMVANLAQQDPGTWFAGLSGATLTAITPTQVSTALTNLSSALPGLAPLASVNPVTTAFTAISGNVSDDMLAALGTATATPGSYATLLAAAGIPATFTSSASTLNTALATAYAGTASGSLPSITSFTPSSGVVGASVIITGTNFSATAANNTVSFNGVQASVTSATATQLIVTVPATAASGNITVLVGGQTATSATSFTVTAAGTGTNAALVGTWKLMTYKLNASPTVTDMSPYNMIEVLAANGDWTFTQPTAVVGVTCQQSGTSTSTATTITTTTVSDPCSVPSMAGTVETNTYSIVGATLTANNGTETFTYQKQTVAAPTITGFTPASGAVGTSVTITGTNFSTTPASNTVNFNGVAASVTSATATQLVVTVPAAATTGTVSVTIAGGTATSATSFTVSASPTYVVQGGLTWMPVTFGDTWTNANAYCTNTTINGLAGWRQPTQTELSALYTSGAMIGQGWTLNWTWSSTPGSTGFHYAVGLAPGGGVNPFADTTTPIPVSCVRFSAGGGVAPGTLLGGAIQGTPLNLTAAVTTYAGGNFGAVDATGTAASFNNLKGVTTDGTNLYLADNYNKKIRKVVIATGVVTTMAGSGTGGAVDATGTAASFWTPWGITTDGINLYVTDFNTIRKIVIATGVVTTIAGSGVPGALDGTGTAATFSSPKGITTDGINLYVADTGNNKIRKIVIATGEVTTLAGSGTFASVNGTGTAAAFMNLDGITTDGTNIFVTENGIGSNGLASDLIRKIVIATGVVTTLAGSGTRASVDGTGTGASFSLPTGITTDGTNLYVTQSNVNAIRKIVMATGVVTTLAGSATGGNTDGTGAAAAFGVLNGITTDGVSLYISDTGNSSIRKIQ